MMIKLEKFTGENTYMFPNGELATPDVIRKKWPAVDKFPHVLEINGNVIEAVGELDALLNIFSIDKTGKSEEEQISALEAATNDNRNLKVNNRATIEERIATSLEKIADLLENNSERN
jgi:hypothetical protein